MNINKYDNLPVRGPMKNHRHDWRRHYGSTGRYRKINGAFPGTHVQRLLHKYKGKNVDVAFSEYCRLVDVCQQYEFWDVFKEDIFGYRRRYIDRWGRWFVDKNKNIQYKPGKGRRTTNLSVDSFDAEYAWVHIETGRKESDWRTPIRRVYNDPQFEYRIIKGFNRTFDDLGPEFKRFVAEQRDKKRKHEREKPAKEYLFKHPIQDGKEEI